jgi:hypothetical protein
MLAEEVLAGTVKNKKNHLRREFLQASGVRDAVEERVMHQHHCV